MRPENWFEECFGSRAKVRILRLLVADPRRVWTEREVAAAIGMSPNTVNRAFADLRSQGWVTLHTVGRSHALRLRDDLRLTKALAAAFDIEARAGSDLYAAIAKALPQGVACQLYGSTARGTADRGSDLDVLIVAKSAEQAEEAAEKVRRAVHETFPVPLQLIALDARTYKARKDSPLFRAIRREGKPLGRVALEAFS